MRRQPNPAFVRDRLSAGPTTHALGIMTRALAKGILLMVFGLFGKNAQATPEAEFWKWFTANEAMLFSWESDGEATFDKVSAAMKKVHPDLTFEFSPVIGGKREFVISAGGIKSAFPAVESLYKSAPSLKRWQWVKFRPRRNPLNDINYGGKHIRVEDVHYLLARDEKKVGIVLFFDGYNEKDKTTFGQIGYLMLDEALGEYVVETQVGFIEFHSRDSKYFPQASPLAELPSQFDEYWNKRTH